jgi:thioester reductase-like protein
MYKTRVNTVVIVKRLLELRVVPRIAVYMDILPNRTVTWIVYVDVRHIVKTAVAHSQYMVLLTFVAMTSNDS